MRLECSAYRGRTIARSLVVCALVTAALLAVLAPERAEAKAVNVTSHAEAAGATVPGVFHCPPRTDAISLAVIATTDYGLNTGDTLVGSSTDHICLYPLLDGSIAYDGVVAFGGRLSGCGAGTLAFRTLGVLSAPDPVDRHDDGSLEVIAASGTGALTGTSGRVPYTGTVGLTLMGMNLVEGKLSC
jgi:hypothetical protein